MKNGERLDGESLRAKGYLAIRGRIADVTVIEARRPRLSKDEKDMLKDGSNACAVARRLAAGKPNIKINVIDIADGAKNPTASCIAELSDGCVSRPEAASRLAEMMRPARYQPDARKRSQ